MAEQTRWHSTGFRQPAHARAQRIYAQVGLTLLLKRARKRARRRCEDAAASYYVMVSLYRSSSRCSSKLERRRLWTAVPVLHCQPVVCPRPAACWCVLRELWSQYLRRPGCCRRCARAPSRVGEADEVGMLVAMDESTALFQGTAWARRRLPRMPAGVGVEIPSIHSDYNLFLGGVDRHGATAALLQCFDAEDALRRQPTELSLYHHTSGQQYAARLEARRPHRPGILARARRPSWPPAGSTSSRSRLAAAGGARRRRRQRSSRRRLQCGR